MASKRRTAWGLLVAILGVTIAILAALWGLFANDAKSIGLNGFGAISLAPLLGLFWLTLIAYALALIVSQTRLALAQSMTLTVFGVAMALIGGGLLTAGLAKFIGLVTLALAFPFGTIAYFVNYSCGSDDLGMWAGIANAFFGGSCFVGVQIAALIATLLKVLALAAILIASIKFAKVKGLWILLAWILLFGIAIFGLFAVLSDLTFVMYPADAVLTAVLGLVLLIYGIVVAIKSLIAVALAIAGQAA